MFEISDEVCKLFIETIHPHVLYSKYVNEPGYLDLIRQHIRCHFILTNLFAEYVAKLNEITDLTLSANNSMI